MISANHPNILTHPIHLISEPNTQLKVADPKSKYFHRYKDYLELREYINNYYATLNYPDALDILCLDPTTVSSLGDNPMNSATPRIRRRDRNIPKDRS